MPLQIYSSCLLPVPHGFTTRHGGVSEGAFRSLNLSLNVGDSPEHVAENVRIVARYAGISPFQIQTASQVHGARVLEDVAPDPSSELTSSCGEADALWTSSSGSAVAVRAADCVPIILVDPVGHRVAAVHSGWRGTELKIAARAVKALEARGTTVSRLLVAIGPSIRACCYAVLPEVASRFFEAFGPNVIRTRAGKHHLDLSAAVRDTLLEAGVRDEHIDLLPGCTSCLAEDFFSHRRDKGRTGRQMGFAVCSF
jgi:YfiH family protein